MIITKPKGVLFACVGHSFQNWYIWGIKMTMAGTHILNTHPDLLYVVTDLKGDVLRKNAAFKEFVSHIKPINFRDLVTVDEDWDEVYEAIAEAKKSPPSPKLFSCQTKGKTGRLRYAKWGVWCMLDKLHFAGMQAIEDVSASSVELQKRNDEIEGILHAIHHDLRQPMRSLSGLITVRSELVKTGGSSDEIQEYDELILRASSDLDKMLSEVLIKVERRLG